MKRSEKVKLIPTLYMTRDMDISRYKTDKPINLSKEKQQRLIGNMSNLLADMIEADADNRNMFCAIRHSMVLMDVFKLNLDWKMSEEENRIKDLIMTYRHDKVSGRYKWENGINPKDIPFYDLLVKLSNKDESLKTFTPELEYPRKEGTEKMNRDKVIYIATCIEDLIDRMIRDNATDEELVDVLKCYLVAINTNCDDLDLMAALKDFEVHVFDDGGTKIG